LDDDYVSPPVAQPPMQQRAAVEVFAPEPIHAANDVPSIRDLLARVEPITIDVVRGKPVVVPLDSMRSRGAPTPLDVEVTVYPDATGRDVEVWHLPYATVGDEQLAEVVAINGDPVPPDVTTWWLGIDPHG
jgi:hypothetical protein